MSRRRSNTQRGSVVPRASPSSCPVWTCSRNRGATRGPAHESALDVVDHRLRRGWVAPVATQVVHNTVFKPAGRAATKVDADGALY